MSEKTYKMKVKLGQNEIEIEGDKDWVDSKLSEFKTLLVTQRDTSPLRQKSASDSTPDVSVISNLQATLAQFYRDKGEPKLHRSKVLIFSYWLTKAEGMGSYNISDISKCYSKLRKPKPKNTTDTMNKIPANYMKIAPNKNNKKAWTISDEGEKYVEAMG